MTRNHSGATLQSKRLKENIASVGIPKSGISSRTSIKRIRPSGGGKTYSEYGDAVALIKPEHEQAVMNNTEHLTNRGIDVNTGKYTCGHRKVYNLRESNGKGSHTDFEIGNHCPACRDTQ